MTHDAARRPDLPVPLISVRGTPAECGAGYGAAAAARIAANLELYRRRFREQVGLDTAAVRAAGERFRAVTRAAHPRIAAMLDGLAEGAGADIADVYALNARTELLYDAQALVRRHPASRAAPPPAPAAVPEAPDGPNGGCTSAGVLGTHTANGHLLLGQNWDWHPDQRDAMVLLATRDERGHAVLTLTEAGMLAKAGLNSAGVGVCVNMLGSDRDGLPPGSNAPDAGHAPLGGHAPPGGHVQPGGSVPDGGGAPGVPYHVLLRSVLEADSLAWAVRTACRTPRNASINLLIGQAGDPAYGDPVTGGELIDLEIVPGDVGWMHPVDGMITHANHLETGLDVYDTLKDWGGSSPFRSARARRLLAAPAAAGTVTEKDLATVFRDHASFPQAICRHVDERDAPVDRSESVYSILLDLDARRFALAAGPPCRHEYAWLGLDDALKAARASAAL